MLTIGLALVFALAVAAYGARRVVRPLSELTDAIRDVSKGDMGGVLVPVRSDDEVGTLARAFNKMATELDQTQRTLVEAEKFAFVGELAAGVAHEVRTSLGVLRSSAQMLARSLPPGEDGSTREMIDMVGQEVDRLGRVVDDLLVLGHRRPMDLRSVDLSEPVRAAVDFVSPQAEERGISITADYSAPVPRVLCDREAISHACVNLLTNAVAALDAGGQVEVEIVRESNGRVGLHVRDDGPGVAPELVDRLFDPFATGRESGIGLGLTFVKRVVHEHRGLVELVPGPHRGAWFRVELPTVEEDSR
jgi:signal transduction histidine kinase